MNQNNQATPNVGDPNSLSDGFDARLVLSYGQKSRVLPRSINVLNVGCSRGLEVLKSASVQPDVVFLGIDCNETALEAARLEADSQGLANVSFKRVEFASLSRLHMPEGGFDVIQVNGNPAQGMDFSELLTALRPLLAEHGLMSVNLPGGRAHYAKISDAINGVIERNAPLRERLEAARDHIDRLVQGDPTCTEWRTASLVDDAEFVDRYMQAGVVHMDVAATWRALEESNMSFIRWSNSTTWDFQTLGLGKEELERVRTLPMNEQFRIVEESRNPSELHLVIAHEGNGPRDRFDLTRAGETHFMVHPETTFGITTRNFWGSTHLDGLTVQRGTEEPVSVRPSPALTALYTLRDQREPFSGLNLVEVMTEDGASLEDALMALHQLMGLELIYAPHEFDVAQFYSAMLTKRASESQETADVVVTPSPALAHDLLTPTPDPAAALPSSASVNRESKAAATQKTSQRDSI